MGLQTFPTLQGVIAEVSNQFVPSAQANAKTRALLTQALRENPTSPFEAMVSTLAQQDAGKVVKFKGNYRVYAAPYMTAVRNAEAGG